jgi:hypothetical protein
MSGKTAPYSNYSVKLKICRLSSTATSSNDFSKVFNYYSILFRSADAHFDSPAADGIIQFQEKLGTVDG